MQKKTRTRTSSVSSSSSKRSRESPESPTSQQNNKKSKRMGDIKRLDSDVQELKGLPANKFDALFSKLDTLQKGQDAIAEDMKLLKQKVGQLDESVAKAHHDIAIAQEDRSALHSQLNIIEQRNLANSFNICGFPRLKPDQAMEIILELGKQLKVQLKKNDIKDIFISNHRNNASSHIAGTFYDERKRDELFESMKKRTANKNPVLIEEVCNLPNDSTCRGTEVRVRSAFTQHTRKLYALARTFANQFEFIWETDGKILLKRDSRSRTIEVKTERQLLSITSQSTSQRMNH